MAESSWRLRTIDLLMRDFSPCTVRAYTREGLAVHRRREELPGSNPAVTIPGRKWVITHVESGCGFAARFFTATEARAKADMLLCIEGLWDNPLEAFRDGLRDIDCRRVNRILGPVCLPGQVSADIKKALAYRAEKRLQNG